jgi:hypothetical protein
MRDPRDVLDHLFSRGVLGSILVGLAVGRVVELSIRLLTPMALTARLAAWGVTTALFVWLYVFWADIEAFASKAADGGADGGGVGDDD